MKNKQKYLSKNPIKKQLPKKANGGLMGNNNISEYDYQQEINIGRNTAEMVSNINPFIKAGHIIGTNVSNALAKKNQDGYTDASKGAQFTANMFNPTDSVSRGVGYLKDGKIGQGLNNLFNPLASIKENRKIKQQVEKRKAFEAELSSAQANFDYNYEGARNYSTVYRHGGPVMYPEGGTVKNTTDKYDTLMPYRDTFKQYGVDNPELYKIFKDSPQSEVGAYYTVAKEQGLGDKFLTNWNNSYAKQTGGWYDPQSTTGLHYIMDKPWVVPTKPVSNSTVHAGDGYIGTTPAPKLTGKLYARGGISQPNAELEKGEPFRTPDGQIGMISNEAPTHEEGGVKVNLPSGTEILGNNESQYGEQFKILGQKLKKAQDRHKKVLESRPTEIARRTSKLMLDKIQKQYDALFAEQEAQKQIPTTGEFGLGGLFTSQGASKFNDILGNIGEYAPIVYNIATGLKKPNKIDPETYYNPYEQQSLNKLAKLKYDPSSELISNQNEQAAYNRGIRGLGLTGNQMAANLAAGSISKTRANSDVYSKANNINSQYASQYANALAQFGQQRAATKLTVDDLNARESAAREGALQAGLAQLSQAIQSGKYQKMQKTRDKQKLALLDSLVQNYSFVNGKWVNKSNGQIATDAELDNYINGN